MIENPWKSIRLVLLIIIFIISVPFLNQQQLIQIFFRPVWFLPSMNRWFILVHLVFVQQIFHQIFKHFDQWKVFRSLHFVHLAWHFDHQQKLPDTFHQRFNDQQQLVLLWVLVLVQHTFHHRVNIENEVQMSDKATARIICIGFFFPRQSIKLAFALFFSLIEEIKRE